MRAVVKNGFEHFLDAEKPDVIGLQEIKMSDKAREKQEFDFAGYLEYWYPAQRSGYSGTAILTKIKPISYQEGLGKEMFDIEGRVQTMEFEKFYFVNAYFPNANHELSRLTYKQKFNAAFLEHVKKLEKKKPVVCCGDFNVAHQEIDLARPKENVGNPGFTKEERSDMDKFIKQGLIDTFRLIHKVDKKYSWWSYRTFARDRGIGWRIDYFLASEKLKNNIKDALILDDVLGSDHAPVGLVI